MKTITGSLSLEDTIENGVRYDKGIECEFVAINKKWAWKIYRSLIMCEFAIELHSRVLALGYAPDIRCNAPQEFISKSGTCYYGYVTEIVECDYERIVERENERGELKETLIDAGIPIYDTHCQNFGIKNGKLVYIDFGQCSSPNLWAEITDGL